VRNHRCRWCMFRSELCLYGVVVFNMFHMCMYLMCMGVFMVYCLLYESGWICLFCLFCVCVCVCVCFRLLFCVQYVFVFVVASFCGTVVSLCYVVLFVSVWAVVCIRCICMIMCLCCCFIVLLVLVWGHCLVLIRCCVLFRVYVVLLFRGVRRRVLFHCLLCMVLYDHSMVSLVLFVRVIVLFLCCVWWSCVFFVGEMCVRCVVAYAISYILINCYCVCSVLIRLCMYIVFVLC